MIVVQRPCPTCGAQMTGGTNHGGGSGQQYECHTCGYVVVIYGYQLWRVR